MARRKDEWLTPEALLLVEGWARDGLTAREIAHNIGISHVTFYKWLDEEETIRKAVWNGREVANRKLENALFKRALGCFETETEVTEIEGEEGRAASRKIRTYTRYYPPDTGALAFAMKNRMPEKWRDRQTHQITADIEDLTPLAELLKQ